MAQDPFEKLQLPEPVKEFWDKIRGALRLVFQWVWTFLMNVAVIPFSTT